ncbi:MAG: tRNA threonylcarbamoyladenosine biosynthesis protein RimN [Hydrogenophilales bacterium 28-61-23]|nr:MAG: tRNA threonylcarbamoyladenosine biosynthesis protein RimN [Hydrogenophilales bacterium 28-61-23]
MPNIRRLRVFLRRGGVIAYATESCYGLGCDPTNRHAVLRILKLKGRPQSKGLILIGADIRQFARYLAPVSGELIARLHEWWPGPNTLLLPASKRCPRWLSGDHDTLAVRVTAHRETARLCRALDMALVSTSANRAGQSAIKDAGTCDKTFGDRVLTLAGRIGRRKRPSRIIEPVSGKTFRL